MPCGAILYFDDQTDAAIRGQWQIIEDAGLPSIMPGKEYPPHLTLVACEDMDMAGLRAHLAPFLADHTPMPIQFCSLGIFTVPPPVVYLAVTPNRTLLNLHTDFLDVARPYMQNININYQPGTWVPHVTLNQGFLPELTGAMVQALLRQPLPRSGLLKELVLADFNPQQPGLTEIFKARLGRFI